MSFDRRLVAARQDLAAAHLEGQIDAPRYVEAKRQRIIAPTAPMRAKPDVGGSYDTELLHGEEIDVYEVADGWAWGQSALDRYVGYVPADCLGPVSQTAPTHRVQTLTAQVYGEPQLKCPPVETLPFGARLTEEANENGYACVGPDRWIPTTQVRRLDQPAADWVAEAEKFLAVPYIWGGRSSAGLDCSALIQLSRQAAGHDCPRDSDMQEAASPAVPDGTKPKRGDLMFWRGHVGVMIDAETLLHANAHHMAVAIESLAAAVTRIEQAGDGAVTRHARLDADVTNT